MVSRSVFSFSLLLAIVSLEFRSTNAKLKHRHRPYVSPLEVKSTNYGGKVIIVGGGAAGMFAAYTLEYLGVDYQVLEANTDIGGRAQELVGFVDVPLDLGPEWIHVQPRVRQELLLFDDTVTEEAIVYKPQTIGIVRHRKLRRRDFLRFFYEDHKFKNATWHGYLTDYVYPYIQNNTELNAVVETIDYSQHDTVNVTTKDGRTFQGNKVIVATPVTVLQGGDINFIPGLPKKKKHAIGRVEMPPILKAWIEFDERFYPDATKVGGVICEDRLYFDALFKKPSNRNVLALFEIGETAKERVVLSDDEIFDTIMAELDEIFDGKASAHYVQHHIQNWSKEPFIRGSYSDNILYSMHKILEPIYNRVYFCGEYLERHHQATVHGAGISGRNVAQQVLLDAA